MDLQKGSVYQLPVKRVSFFNGMKYYIVECDGKEYRVRMFPYQASNIDSLRCVYTGDTIHGTPQFEQLYSEVLKCFYKEGYIYPFKIIQECIDQNTGSFYYSLTDEYGLFHRVYMTQNPMYKQGEKVEARVVEINDKYLSLELMPSKSSKASFSLGDLIDLKQAMTPSSLDFSKLNAYRDTTLRDYQIENKRKVYEAWQSCRSVMLQMPTGTGKTRLFVSIARDIFDYGHSIKKQFKVLILAHRKELIQQISEHLGEKYRLAHGLIMSQNIEQRQFSMQVGSVPTLNRRLERWEDKNFDVIIIDEAHHVKAKSYKKIIDLFPNAKILGVTATPYRLNHAGFRPEFDQLIVSPSVAEFIKKGYLCEFDYYSIRPNSELQKEIDRMKLDFEGDYKESEMMDVMDRDFVRADILDAFLRYAKDKKGIIYTISRAHNEHLAAKFQEAGIVSAAIDSETPKEKRDELVNKFRRGEIQVLFNVNIFSEGFDCPDVEVIQLARPTKSLSMYLQQVGRGLRPAKGKEKLIILDNVGLYNKFGFPSARRKWNYHFEGQEVDETPAAHSMDHDEEREIKDIIEGNEEVAMLHTSTDEVVTSSELDSIVRDYKSNFLEYALKDLDAHTANGYVNSIENYLDGYIKEHFNSSFRSMFNTVNVEELQSIRDYLAKDKEYVEFNILKHHRYSAAFRKYQAFASWFNAHQNDSPDIPAIENSEDVQAPIHDLRSLFYEFLIQNKYSKQGAELVIRILTEQIDKFIKKVVYPGHKTVFNTSDTDCLLQYLDALLRDLGFQNFNRMKNSRPVQSLRTYIEFTRSLNPSESKTELKSNTDVAPSYQYEEEYTNYLIERGINKPSIRRYVANIKEDIDPLIRRDIDASFTSLFDTIDGVHIKTIYELLSEEKDYKDINSTKYNSPDAAFRKYIDFVDSLKPAEEKSDKASKAAKKAPCLTANNAFETSKETSLSPGSDLSLQELDAQIAEIDNLLSLLKKNHLPIAPEINERLTHLQNQKDAALQRALIVQTVHQYLELYKLEKVLVFKGAGNPPEIEILKPKVDPVLSEEYDDIERIISLMDKNHILVPSDVRIRYNNLSKKVEIKKSINDFENWFLGYVSYLKLDSFELESISYSPETDCIINLKKSVQTGVMNDQPKNTKPFVIDNTPIRSPRDRASLRVILGNGKVLDKGTATDIFVEAVEHIGIERVKACNITMYGPMISSTQHPDYKAQCKPLSNGEYLNTGSTTARKAQIINSIAKYYNLPIRAELY